MEICTWMKSNLLILNLDKTEVVHFSSRHKKVVKELTSLKIGQSIITPSNSVRKLGVHFECSGNFNVHINHICKSAYFALHRIGKLRTLLDQAATEKLVHAFVTSRLDYCNSLLYGCPESHLDKLQSIQNAAARLLKRQKNLNI
ncbi:hypothetical protein HOLleu_03134 [Holothuria leucospilota]|uniref:Uncharacterized protein n=1 Tax=Holothuria leucospilota TaxID=206669 RepID=A0A9Q1CR81_HOLLE|nr:hypothetical protein HOLleu_03134 [Holothuria leucospilota]